MALHNDVFKQQIWEFFQNDIDSCLLVSKDIQKKKKRSMFKGGLNLTAALSMMIIIEMCASYCSGRDTNENTFAEFMKRYFSRYEALFQIKEVNKKIFRIFRHGLAHNWSPKMGGVSMDFRLKQSIVIVNDTPVLNVPALFSVMKKGIEDYEKDLDRNEGLRNLFEKRYKDIVSKDSLEVNSLRKLINTALQK